MALIHMGMMARPCIGTMAHGDDCAATHWVDGAAAHGDDGTTQGDDGAGLMQDNTPAYRETAEQQLSAMPDAMGSRDAAHQMPHPAAANKQNAGHVKPMQQQPESHAEASSRSVSSQERKPSLQP